MTLTHPWMLLLAAVPLLWALVEFRRRGWNRGLLCKALTFAAILAALAQPAIHFSHARMAVAVLADASASISDDDLAQAAHVISEIRQERGRNEVLVVPFARTPGAILAGKAVLERISGEASRATDLETAVRSAIAGMPAEFVPRLVLISDGRENSGSIARAIWQARQLHIPVDTIALSGRPQPALRVESVSLPDAAFTGEKFPVDLLVSAPVRTEATLDLLADGKSLGSTPVVLEEGETRVHAHASVSTPGSFDLTGVIRTSGNPAGAPPTEVRFDRAITLRQPQVLYISQDPAAMDANLLQTLGSARFEVTKAAAPARQSLSNYQIVVLNNIDLQDLPPGDKDRLEAFVKNGGGLLVIGGERNVFPEDRAFEDAIDRTLPATIAPPRSPEGTCVVLVIDKSSSMEGRKIELARLAAIGVVDNLRPTDKVGVLIFDNSFQWAVPLRRAVDKDLIRSLVAGIAPDGGTQIAPALAEAYHRVQSVRATYKHIVLLTDGISEEGDSLDLARDAETHRVTISTVGLGQDVNRAYLEKVAANAGGRSYFLTDPAGLEQILLQDVMEHTGSTAVEKPLRPAVERKAEILDGVGMESAPALQGYVKFIAKPAAETILGIDDNQPLFARWQFGLGRSAVFTSDAKSRWAASWIGWKGYDRFWTNVFRDLLPHAGLGDSSVAFDSASGNLTVEYRPAEPATEAPAIFVFGPGGYQRPVQLTRSADGSFAGRVPVGSRQGLFRVRPLAESRAFPELGYYREEQELRDHDSNPVLLRQAAAYTGGRFNPQPAQVFDPAGRSLPSVLQLWPGLLALAIALNLLELALRKGLLG